MGTTEWILILIWAVGQITAVILAYINTRVKLKELEIRIENMEIAIKDNKTDLHEHEKMNEKAFDKFESKIDQVYEAINEVKTFLMTKKRG